MKKITFTDEEVNELKAFYYEELDRITRRMEVIKSFLAKLGTDISGNVVKVSNDNYEQTNTVDENYELVSAKRGRNIKAEGSYNESKKSLTTSKIINKIIKDKTAEVEVTEKKKPGRKSLWGAFIFGELNKKEIPLPSATLIDNAIKHFNAKNDDEKEKIKSSIIGILSKLSTREKTLIQFREKGIKNKYFCLPEWLDEQGELKLHIAQKFEKSKK